MCLLYLLILYIRRRFYDWWTHAKNINAIISNLICVCVCVWMYDCEVNHRITAIVFSNSLWIVCRLLANIGLFFLYDRTASTEYLGNSGRNDVELCSWLIHPIQLLKVHRIEFFYDWMCAGVWLIQYYNAQMPWTIAWNRLHSDFFVFSLLLRNRTL